MSSVTFPGEDVRELAVCVTLGLSEQTCPSFSRMAHRPTYASYVGGFSRWINHSCGSALRCILGDFFERGETSCRLLSHSARDAGHLAQDPGRIVTPSTAAPYRLSVSLSFNFPNWLSSQSSHAAKEAGAEEAAAELTPPPSPQGRSRLL